MKGIKKKKLLITLFAIFLVLSIVGITNLISFAQNINSYKEASISQGTIPKISIKFDKSVYEVMQGSKIEIKANINDDELNKEGDHPDKVEVKWYKLTGGRPSPYELVKNEDGTILTSDTLTIKNAQVSDAKIYMAFANIMQWNEETSKYEEMKEGKYIKTFYSEQIKVDVITELNIDLKKEDKRLQGNKDDGYTLELEKNETYKLNLDLYRMKDGVKVAPQQVLDIKWNSSDNKIVEVNSSGHLIAREYCNEGVKITVRVTDIDYTEKEVNIIVKIKSIPVTDVKINEQDVQIKVEEQATLTATVTPETATNKTLTWKLYENSEENIIEIDEERGIITGKKIGEAKVVAIADGITSKPIIIKVIETPVEGITDELTTIDTATNKVNISLLENGDGSTESQYTITIHPEVLPKTATNKKIKWTSENDNIVKVRENKNGTVTFIAGKYVEGQKNDCDITAESDENKDIKRIYHVTLKDKIIPVNVDNGLIITTEKNGKEVELTTSSVEEIIVGETIDFGFKVNPQDATYKNDIWTVSSTWEKVEPRPTNVISIDNSGVVTAKEEGIAYVRITVTCQNEACKTHSTYVTVKVNPKPVVKVENVEIEGEKSISLQKNEKINLTAKITPDDATDKTITWSSNKPEIAKVNSSTGEVTALSKGTAIITATVDGKSDSVEINVKTIEVEYIEISDLTLQVKDNSIIGENKLKVTFYPPNAEDTEVVWESSDNTIVEIRDDGIIVPKDVGTEIKKATITVSLKNNPNKKASCDVIVIPSKAHVIVYTIDQKKNFISGIKLRLTGTDEKGLEIEPRELTTNGKYDFGVISNGVYTIETYIPKARSISMVSDLDIIDYVEICNFEIIDGEILYSNSTEKLNAADSLVLVSIVDYPNEDENGLVADIGAGENYGKDGKSILELYEEYDEVKEIPVESITDELANTNITLVENSEGSTQHMKIIHPRVLPDNATNKKITWKSDNEEVAKVIENDDGSVTFVAGEYKENNNKCTITATAHNGKERKYIITVTKNAKEVTDVKITLNGVEYLTEPYKLKVGEEIDLNFEVSPTDATYEEDLWSFDPEVGSPADVISVDNSGVVIANAIGKACVKVIIITCQNEMREARFLVEVIPTAVEEVEIVGQENLILQKGDSKKLTVKITPEDATDKTVIWSSDDESVAKVDSDGNVTAVGSGSTIIRVKSKDGNKEDFCNVIVPKINVESIEISNKTLIVRDDEINGEKKLTFTFSPEDADNAEFGWESSNPEIAEVQDGVIIPKTEGKTIIKVFVMDNKNVCDICEVTVIASKTEENPGENKPEEEKDPEHKPDEEEKNPEHKPDEGENNSENKQDKEENNSAPKTSDIPIVTYIVLMVVSLMIIAFIIIKRNKKTKSKRRFKSK